MITLREAIREFEEKASDCLKYERVYRDYIKDYTFLDKEACLKAARRSKEEAEKCIQIADWLKELVRLRGDEKNNGNELNFDILGTPICILM